MVRDVFCKNCDTKLGWMYVSVNKNPSFKCKSYIRFLTPFIVCYCSPSLIRTKLTLYMMTYAMNRILFIFD